MLTAIIIISIILILYVLFNNKLKFENQNKILIPNIVISGDSINNYINFEENITISDYDEIIPGLPKIIWICWFQGIEKLPFIVVEVIKSWIKLNPTWKVFLITNENVKNITGLEFKDGQTLQARSDILRIKLLSKYGGVWADGTLMCMQPLDNWIYKHISNQFWMYHSNGKYPCSWFLVSSKKSALIQEWNKLMEKYWENRNSAHNYFFMDLLFKNELKNKETIISKEWKKVPFLECNENGSSHYIAGKVYKEPSNEILKHINNENKPFVIKLDKNLIFDKKKFFNGHYIINLTKTKKDFEIVIARYKEDISWSDNYKNFRTIYNKGPDDLPNVEYVKRENYGRDPEVFLNHIIHNYYNLANVTMFFQGSYNSRDDQIIKKINNFISDDPNYLYYENPRNDLPDKDSILKQPNKWDNNKIMIDNDKINEEIKIDNFDKIYEDFFNKEYIKTDIIWTPGMYISAGKNVIHKTPIDTYIKMYNFLMKNKYNTIDVYYRGCIIERLLLHCFY